MIRTADPDLQRRRSSEIAIAAARVFLAKGFHGASMQDVAREAGVSMGLLYRYFEDKAALIAAAATIDRASMLAEIAELGEVADPLAGLEALLASIEVTALEPGYVDLVTEVAAEACRNPRVAAVLKEDELELYTALVAALTRQQAAGRLRADADLASFALLYLTLADALALRLRFEPEQPIAPLISVFSPSIRALKP
ncbi:TetR/AcrR family transcriptional regulator [Caulobacter sp. ErkDOM-YI]|uniref:TetR/AcrR family transcriptional regulator n=1 Tax=unclassified Caulobacter TaxID=2648921 RepID=UPI003AF4BAEA